MATMMITKTLSPHQHKLYSEILTRVRLGVRALELLHIGLEEDFATLYDLTGHQVFARARDALHSAPHPLIHQGIPQ
jgi:hypothetical protein